MLARIRIRGRQGRGERPGRAAARVDYRLAAVVARPGRRAGHRGVAVDRDRCAEVAGAVEEDLLLLLPDGAGLDERVHRVGAAAGRTYERARALDRHGLAECLARAAVRGLDLGVELPDAAGAHVNVGGARISAEGAVVRCADDQPVAVDRNGPAKALACARTVACVELRLLHPVAGAGVPRVHVNHAARRAVQFGAHHQGIAADCGHRAHVLGLESIGGDQLGLLRPCDHAIDGQGMKHQVAQVQIGDVDRVHRDVRRAVPGQYVEVRQAVYDHRFDAGEIEDVAADIDLPGVRHRAARRVGAGRHAISGDAQRIAGGIRTTVEGYRDFAARHALLEFCEQQVVADVAVECGDVAAIVDAILDVEGVVAGAGVHRGVEVVHAIEELGHIVAAAERDVDVLAGARIDVHRRRGAVLAQDHGRIANCGGVVAEHAAEQIGPFGVGDQGIRLRREDVGERPPGKRQVGIRSPRRVVEVDRVGAVLAVNHDGNAANAVGRRRKRIDGEPSKREAAAYDRRSEVDGVGARTGIDGERGVLAAQRILFAVGSLQIDRVIAEARVQHHGFHAAINHVVHAAALDRCGVEAPRRGSAVTIVQQNFGLQLVAYGVRLPGGIALVVEIELVLRLGT